MPATTVAKLIDTSLCIGCKACEVACQEWNDQEFTMGVFNNTYQTLPDLAPNFWNLIKFREREENGNLAWLMAKYQCMHCAEPPCVPVCPVQATWQEKDGITVIDYDWCIGCRYCEAACPYFARRFNFAKPSIPKDKINPDMSYLGNRPRQKGVMEKCHFCIQRTRTGRYPACLEVCPTGSRKFGNILDPNSEVSHILRNKRVFVLKEEVGTLPRFFYYFDV